MRCVPPCWGEGYGWFWQVEAHKQYLKNPALLLLSPRSSLVAALPIWRQSWFALVVGATIVVVNTRDPLESVAATTTRTSVVLKLPLYQELPSTEVRSRSRFCSCDFYVICSQVCKHCLDCWYWIIEYELHLYYWLEQILCVSCRWSLRRRMLV